MRISLNGEHLVKGTFNAFGAAGETCLTVSDESAEKVFAEAAKLGMKREGVCVVRVEGENPSAAAAQALMGYFHGAYRFSKAALRRVDRWKKDREVFAMRDELCDYGSGELVIDCDADVYDALGHAAILARCEGYARMLGNLPNNYLHVAQMEKYLTDMADGCGLKVRVLGEAELTELGCGGILAVNQGSSAEAKMIVLEHRVSDGASIALVGKGVMFDAGGYHLKDINGMNGMKFDMCGAANVAGVMEYVARSKSEKNVIAILPLVENVISPDAVKMGDVITTLSGKTVEVYNTDAEGRLILCDVLTYAQRLGAEYVIDLATLTYGAHGALGDDCGAYFCNDEPLARIFENIARKTGELVWRLPLAERYHEALKWSEVADLANYAPGFGAAASTAACFLEEFIEEGAKWVHIDAVGPSSRRGGSATECKGATGYGLRMLAQICG